MTNDEISRRMLLGAGVGLAAGVLAPTNVGVAGHASSLSRNEVYARARGAVGDDPGLWWYSGRLWGKLVNDKAVQFFSVEGFSFNRMVRKDDGGLRQIMEECGFWKDPATGEILDEWINPLNGLKCEPGHFRSRQDLTFSLDGKLVGRDRFEGQITDPVISGTTTWISEILVGAFPSTREPDQDPLTYVGPARTGTSLANYTMDTDAVHAANAGFVESTMHFQSMGNWYPWMRLGQAPGQQMFELFGRKIRSIDEIPADLRATLDERRAGFLKDPNLD